MMRLFNDSYTELFTSTIKKEFKIKMIEYNGISIKLQIWEQPSYSNQLKTMSTRNFVGGMNGFVFVYDVTNEDSFYNIHEYKETFGTRCSVLIGNKCDLKERRVISTERGQQLANEYGMTFYETSARTNMNVLESFIAHTKDVVEIQGAELAQQTARGVMSKCSCFIL